MSVIFAPDPPRRKHGVAEGRNSIPERAKLGAGGIRPLDRKFPDPESQGLRQRERLDVESEAGLPQAGKDRPRGALPEGLESALGVGKARDACQAEGPVEEASGQLAGGRLAHGNHAQRVAPAPDQDVSPLRILQKSPDKAERDAQVGIHEKHPLPVCGEHAGLDRMSFAVGGGIGADHEPGIVAGGGPGGQFRIILAGLDDHEEFPWLAGKGLPDGGKCARQAEGLIPCGDDNADARGLIRDAHSAYPKRVFARLSKLPWLEIGILFAAVFLRTWMIGIKPPHFDEGVNGWFADQMTASGFYRYDPTNYHGPLHFYAVFLSQTLFGRHLWALRLPAILASLLCLAALLSLRRFFGRPATLLAAAAMAVSPAYTFYGRYSIHESWQVLFSILFLRGILGLWEAGDRRSLAILILSAAGMVLTKETYLLHIGCFFLAGVVLVLWQRVIPSRPALAWSRRRWTKDDAIVSGGLATLLVLFFYSGNFLDFPSLKGLYETFAAWFQTGVDAGGHEKTSYAIGPLNYYWVALMARYEWPALLGLVACLRFVAPSDARLRYIAIMAGGVLLAYSIIPYKTPWCIISILWPFYLVLGGFLSGLAGRLGGLVRGAVVLVIASSLVPAWRLNFLNFSDDSEPYVYVQTYPDINGFTGPLLELAESDPRRYGMTGLILLESYYPLPWMLGDFTRLGYYGKDNPPANWDADFIAVESAREGEVEPHLTGDFYKRRFRLRSAQDECTAYFSAPLFRERFGGEPEFQPANP